MMRRALIVSWSDDVVVRVIQGRFDPGAVAGRIVFIGGTASRFQDVWTTPLGPNQPGLYIQALAARTLLAEYAAASQQTWR